MGKTGVDSWALTDFQLGFVEQLALERQFFAAGTKTTQPRQAQLFFQQAEQLLLFGDEGLSLFEQRLLFGEFGFLIGKPHLLIGKKMIFFFENPKQIGCGEWRWRRWMSDAIFMEQIITLSSA